jgi:hypothetical protein
MNGKTFLLTLKTSGFKNGDLETLKLFIHKYEYHLNFISFDDRGWLRVRIFPNREPDFIDKKKTSMLLYVNGTPVANRYDDKKTGAVNRIAHTLMYKGSRFGLIRPVKVSEWTRNEGEEVDYNFQNYSDKEFTEFFTEIDLLLPIEFIESLV